jgi:electron transfer flavoprotein alpha subunit
MKSTKFLRSTLVLVEHSKNKIHPSTYNTITAAKQLGKPITALVTGHDFDAVVKSTSQIQGIDNVLVYPTSDQVAERVSDILINAQENGKFTHIVTNHSPFGRNSLPRLAAQYNVQPITDVMTIVSPTTFVRPIYAGNALCQVESQNTLHLLTIRSTSFEKTASHDKSAPVTQKTVPEGNYPKWISEILVKNERPELTSARIVIAGGRGLKSEENFKILYTLADKLGAAVGASRAAVDAGFAPNDLQIGQTGKIVAPDLYIGFGISGAIQHLAGMKDAKMIVSINKDKEAPIFAVSDLGLVEDLFKVVPEMSKLVKE